MIRVESLRDGVLDRPLGFARGDEQIYDFRFGLRFFTALRFVQNDNSILDLGVLRLPRRRDESGLLAMIL